MNVALLARGDASDLAAAQWTAAQCHTCDDVHVVVPYTELAVTGCAWTPAVRAADAHRDAARRRAAALAARVRGSSADLLPVGCSAVQGSRPQVLAAFAQCCDVVVTGVPANAQVADAITQAVYALARTDDHSCPRSGVVLVPEASKRDAGAVVLVGSHDRIRPATLRAAASAAGRLGTEFCVLTQRSDGVGARRYARMSVDDADRSAIAEVAGQGVVTRFRSTRRAITDCLRSMGDLALVVCDCSDEPAWHELRDAAAVALGELAVPVLLLGQSPRRW